MQARRRAGLSSFPGIPPAISACRVSDPTPHDAAGCSPFPGPSAASPGRSSTRRTPGASGHTSPRRHQLNGPPRPRSCPETSAHKPAATWRQSLPACSSSSALRSSFEPKIISSGWTTSPGVDHYRIVDLLRIVQEHVAHPEFYGSYSMRNVAPAVAHDVTYADLDIADG